MMIFWKTVSVVCIIAVIALIVGIVLNPLGITAAAYMIVGGYLTLAIGACAGLAGLAYAIIMDKPAK